MKILGNILKMRTEEIHPVNYYLPVGNQEIYLNDLINHEIEIKYLNEINCIRCGRKTPKSFFQGYCYPCFRSAPETEECVLHPELCRAHEGIARNMDFAKSHCLIDHIVYLSYTSEIKVGVTRNTQIPARWIDQGAIAAIEIARTPNRYLAGVIEVLLKSNYPDKTNWRKMITETVLPLDLLNEKDHAINFFTDNLRQFSSKDTHIFKIQYPGTLPNNKLRSFDLYSNSFLRDILVGIKGQYLLFNSGYVINIRKYGGFLVEITV